MTGKARILFVDDEKRVLKSMRGLFRREFELFLTTEGADAVRITSENAIDVVVADQRMPGMSGTEVLGKVKELSPNTVRILLTGYADPDAVEGSINVGEVFRFLSKPCSPKVLRDTLNLAVEASRESLPRERKRVQSNEHSPASQPTVTRLQEVPVLHRSAVAGRPYSKPRQLTPVASGVPVIPAPGQKSMLPDKQKASQSVVPIKRAEVSAFTTDGVSSHWRNSTTVVLSGDTSHEFKAPDFSSSSAAHYKNVGIVFFTVDPNFVETAMRAASSDRSVTLATSLAKVANTIEREGAGVLITDITANSAVLKRMINTLKQQLPALVTIVASDSRDTTDMISLINHGQVFRYILKPIEPKKLMYEINAAAIKHLDLVENPGSAKRHQVSNLHDTGNSPETLNKFVSRIRALRSGQYQPHEPSS